MRPDTRTDLQSDTRHVVVPGEYGRLVNINPDALAPEERIRYNQGWNNHHFNEYVSDLISVQRTVPDLRNTQ